MTRMTGPDCAVMCNLINTHAHKHTHTHTQTHTDTLTNTRHDNRPIREKNVLFLFGEGGVGWGGVGGG